MDSIGLLIDGPRRDKEEIPLLNATHHMEINLNKCCSSEDDFARSSKLGEI